MIAKSLNRAMAVKEWKAAHLAAALSDRGHDVAPSTVMRWMAGSNDPQSRLLVAIADALGVTADDLLRSDSRQGEEG